MGTYSWKAEKRFKSPGPQPNGLHAADDGLWIIDQVSLKAQKIDWDSGNLLHEIDTETEHSSGITEGNGGLWISSTFGLEIVKVDPQTGETLERHPDPGEGYVASAEGQENARLSSSHGLEWRDGKIYAAAPPTQRIHVIEVSTWREVDQFPTGGLRVHGIAWNNDGSLWVSDTSAGTIILMDLERSGRICEVLRVNEPDEVHGMTIRDGELWYCDATTCDIGVLKRP